LLGLDIGSSSIKAALLDTAGRGVGEAAVATPFVTEGGRVEMEVDALLDASAAETLVGRMATVPDMVTASANRVAVTVYPGGEEWAVLVGAARAGLVIEVEAAARGRSPADLDALGEQDWVDVLGELTARTVEAYHRLTRVLGPRRGWSSSAAAAPARLGWSPSRPPSPSQSSPRR
jgi:hypothetical protein